MAQSVKPRTTKLPQVRTTLAQRRFLESYTELGNMHHACLVTKVGRQTVYDWLKQEDFRARFEEASAEAVEVLEMEARRRAVVGVEEPIYHRGEEIGTVRKFSDTLLIFLLKGLRPEMYRDRYDARISGPGGGPVQIDHTSTRQLAQQIESSDTARELAEALVIEMLPTGEEEDDA